MQERERSGIDCIYPFGINVHIVLSSTLDIGGVESNDGEAEDEEQEVDNGEGEIALGDVDASHDGRWRERKIKWVIR